MLKKMVHDIFFVLLSCQLQRQSLHLANANTVLHAFFLMLILISRLGRTLAPTTQ